MRIGITGTPGTGKTAVAAELCARGIPVVDLAQLAEDADAIVGMDEDRGSKIVDEVALADAFETAAAVLEADVEVVACESHYAHDMPVDLVVVLRCEPRALAARLAARGWAEAKVRENAEAEAMGIIAAEALHGKPEATEIDTTTLPVAKAAALALARARGARRPPPDPAKWDVGMLPWV